MPLHIRGENTSNLPIIRGAFVVLIVLATAFFMVWYLTLNDWSRGEQWILFPENLNVSRDEVIFSKCT